MENLVMAPTGKTPAVELDFTNAALSLTGRSYPVNSLLFYDDLISWVSQYVEQQPQRQTSVMIDLEYCDSSSMKGILEFLRPLQQMKDFVNVNWVVVEDDLDYVEDLRFLLDLSIQVIKKGE